MPEIRAHVVTATLTYRGHALRIDEPARKAWIVDRTTGMPVEGRELTDVEWSSADGNVWHVTGVDADGVSVKWRASRACARCASPAIFETPDYEVPV